MFLGHGVVHRASLSFALDANVWVRYTAVCTPPQVGSLGLCRYARYRSVRPTKRNPRAGIHRQGGQGEGRARALGRGYLDPSMPRTWLSGPVNAVSSRLRLANTFIDDFTR